MICYSLDMLCENCKKYSYKGPLPNCGVCPKSEFTPNLFIRIPKTASVSIHVVPGIDAYHKVVSGIGHNTAEQLKEFLGEDLYNSRFTFAIARNPYDRLVSAYHYFVQKAARKWSKALAKEFPTFKSFCYQFNREKYEGERQQFRLQKEFVVDKNDEVIVDYIGRFESLHQSWEVIKKRLNLSDSLDHLNKSKHKAWQSYYDEKCQDIVYRSYKEDFEFFGYPEKI